MKQQFLNAKGWEERYRLIIQLGKNLPQPDEQTLAQMQPITGCEAKVWFKINEKNDRTFDFEAFSEARIINGLLWILLQEINGKTAEQLQSFDLTAYFSELGIAQRLSTTRLNGLKQIENLLHQL
ncbi:TPA: SufE family protein [Pasteurella multocida]|nr:SufE family protein [Pasteurella multocida]